MTTTQTPPTDTERDAATRDLLSLLSRNLNAERQLAEIMVRADLASEDFLNQHLGSIQVYISLRESLQPEIERLTRELITEETEQKGIPTPFGTPKLTKSTSLDVADEEKTISRIEQWAMGELETPALNEAEVLDPYDQLLRITTELDLEALERLSDEALDDLGIIRATEQKFSLKLPTSVTPKAVKTKLKQSQKGEGKS